MNLKQKLRKKLKKNGGFTLIEMLIVVAIIAILVVVSIPMVSSSLDKAKIATDDANERAAKGAAIAEYLLDESKMGTAQTYCYDAETGKATLGTAGCASVTDYGNGTTTNGAGETVTARNGHVHVQIGTDSTATVTWVE